MAAISNVDEVTEILFPIFKQHNVKKAVLFGSVAKNTAHSGSDLDILVDSRLKGLRFLGLLEDIRQAVSMEVDLIDISHIEKGSAVETEIEKTGVVIYEQ